MRRKIKQKIGFLHPERGVNEPVRQRGRRLPLNTPGRETACRGHSRTRKVPESSVSVSPDVRKKPETHVDGGKSFRMVRNTAFPTPKYFERLRICCILRQNIFKG